MSGFLRNIFSLTTLSVVLSYVYIKNAFSIIVLIYPIWFLFNLYFHTFHEFEKKQMPTPRIYNSGIPMVIAFLISVYIMGYPLYQYFFNS